MKHLLALSLVLGSLQSMAATTATLNLKGVIAPILDISVSPETLATNLPLNTGVTKQKIAKLVEKSNSASGYKVSATSQNGSKLVRTGDAASFVNYQLSYNNGGDVTLTTTASVLNTNSQRGQFERD